jgi:hypothetical protein
MTHLVRDCEKGDELIQHAGGEYDCQNDRGEPAGYRLVPVPGVDLWERVPLQEKRRRLACDECTQPGPAREALLTSLLRSLSLTKSSCSFLGFYCSRQPVSSQRMRVCGCQESALTFPQQRCKYYQRRAPHEVHTAGTAAGSAHPAGTHFTSTPEGLAMAASLLTLLMSLNIANESFQNFFHFRVTSLNHSRGLCATPVHNERTKRSRCQRMEWISRRRVSYGKEMVRPVAVHFLRLDTGGRDVFALAGKVVVVLDNLVPVHDAPACTKAENIAIR